MLVVLDNMQVCFFSMVLLGNVSKWHIHSHQVEMLCVALEGV